MQLDDFVADALSELQAAGLMRQLRLVESAQGPRILLAGREVVNFSANDYLGLANDPILKRAAIAAVERYGVGSGASRLVCGNLDPYANLEARLSAFKGKEAALVFGSGYAANVGCICALVGRGDTVILDKLDHASIIDGARQSGASIRIYPHGDLNKLERLIQSAVRAGGRTLVITETVFSMDGDLARLKEIAGVTGKYGAWLMLDEAHATGLYGKHRRGLAEAAGVEDQVDLTIGTLSKAFGSVGGFACGSRKLMDFMINRARSLIYSTALPPAMLAASAAAVEFVMSDAGADRCRQLWQRVGQLRSGLESLGFKNDSESPILPIRIGEEAAAMEFSRQLLDRGVLVPAIRYPTVARGAARLRVTLSATHSPEQVQGFLDVLGQLTFPKS